LALALGNYASPKSDNTEGDAEVNIVKAAITKSAFKFAILVEEETEFLLSLLYCTELYFHSNKVK